MQCVHDGLAAMVKLYQIAMEDISKTQPDSSSADGSTKWAVWHEATLRAINFYLSRPRTGRFMVNITPRTVSAHRPRLEPFRAIQAIFSALV